MITDIKRVAVITHILGTVHVDLTGQATVVTSIPRWVTTF
jgi:hypothetical protein